MQLLKQGKLVMMETKNLGMAALQTVLYNAAMVFSTPQQSSVMTEIETTEMAAALLAKNRIQISAYPWG